MGGKGRREQEALGWTSFLYPSLLHLGTFARIFFEEEKEDKELGLEFDETSFAFETSLPQHSGQDQE